MKARNPRHETRSEFKAPKKEMTETGTARDAVSVISSFSASRSFRNSCFGFGLTRAAGSGCLACVRRASLPERGFGQEFGPAGDGGGGLAGVLFRQQSEVAEDRLQQQVSAHRAAPSV